MKEYISKDSVRGNLIAVDPSAVLSELSKGKFHISYTKGNYADEVRTINYINSVLDALDTLEKKYDELNQHANSFIADFQNAPQITPVGSDILSYLDL